MLVNLRKLRLHYYFNIYRHYHLESSHYIITTISIIIVTYQEKLMNQPQSKWSGRCMLQANESTSSQYFLHRIWINLVIIIYKLITKKPENKNKMQLINREVEFYQWCWACDDQKPRIEWPPIFFCFLLFKLMFTENLNEKD